MLDTDRRSAAHLTVGSITVTYNSEPFIERHLKSLVGLRDLDTIAVIDNDSPDNTHVVLKRFVDRIAGRDIAVHRSIDNVGFGTANNEMAKTLDTDLILFINPDVFVDDPELLVKAKQSFVDPSIGLVGCGLYQADGALDHACKRGEPTVVASLAYYLGLDRRFPRMPWLSKYRAGHVRSDEVGKVDAVNGAFMLIRKSLFDDCGGFDHRFWMYAEDLDLCRAVRHRGYSVLYRGDLRATHLKGASSGNRRSPKADEAFYESMVSYYRKWYGPRSARARVVSLLAGARLKLTRYR